MFVVSEAEAAAIRAIFHERGELSAAVELRRLFPRIPDTAQARKCVRMLAGWRPPPKRQPRLARSASARLADAARQWLALDFADAGLRATAYHFKPLSRGRQDTLVQPAPWPNRARKQSGEQADLPAFDIEERCDN
jgi:hypothetical protein